MPRVLLLDAAGQLAINPPVEFELLRHNHRRVENLTLETGRQIRVDTIEGDVLELGLVATLTEGATLELIVRLADDGSEATRIIIDLAASTIAIDASHAEAACEVWRRFPNVDPHESIVRSVDVQVAPFSLRPGEPLQLRVFLDKSILEVYANGRQCVTERIYPQPESRGLALWSRRGAVAVIALDAWDMAVTNGI
jgi:beta-fructofuranosidase